MRLYIVDILEMTLSEYYMDTSQITHAIDQGEMAEIDVS